MFIENIKKYLDESGSDKQSDHNYSMAYDTLLSDKKIDNMLEIGIANFVPEKSSLWAWANIFPNANVYGIDIVPEKMIESERIKTFIVDQSSEEQLNNFKDSLDVTFDFILDDGSHVFEHAWLTFTKLFGCLSEGGIYLIEDIQKDKLNWQQSISEWAYVLDNITGIKYVIVDCLPEKNDDSVVIGIWKDA